MAATLGQAAPYPSGGEPITWKQKDGTVLHLRVLGDDFLAVTQTEDGFTVLYDDKSGNYMLAQKDPNTGVLVPSAVPAHLPRPANIKPGLRDPPAVARTKRKAMEDMYDTERKKAFEARLRARRLKKAADAGQAAAVEDVQAMGSLSAAELDGLAAPVSGARVGLMILVQFPDDPATTDIDPVTFPTTQSKVTRYCNEVGYVDDGNTGSVRDYFYDQSETKLTLTHVVTAIVTLPNPRNKYNYANYPTNTTLPTSGTAGRAMLTDAITILKNQGFDFSSLSVNGSNQVLATSILFAGPTSGQWSFGLWPHASAVSQINVGTVAAPRYIYRYQCTNASSEAIPIGTVCHELGHLLLQYPDLYDADTSDGDSEGVGEHCLMGSANHLNGGKTPGPINLYLKDFSGWATLTDITPTTNTDVILPTTGAKGHRIKKPGTATEYFLVENRGSGDKWATSTRDQGVLIWHVDEAVTTGNNRQQMTSSQHYLISVEQADGLFDLENNRGRGDADDLFDLSDGTFDDTTTPSSKWWSAAASGVEINVLSVPSSKMLVRFGTNAKPGITSPLSATGSLGWVFSYQITATLNPSSFGATGLPSGLTVNSASGLISGTPTESGVFTVSLSATNGAGTSTVPMALTVNSPKSSIYDDFEPAVDSTQWAELTGSLTANKNAAAGPGNYGNSLWFSGSGGRQATTASVDVTAGGNVHFKFAASDGSSYPWEKIETGEGVVLEYTTDGSTFTQLSGPYTNTTWQSYTVPVPPAAQTAATGFRFRQLAYSGVNSDHCAIDDVFIGQGGLPVPIITLEQPTGTPLANGGAVDYGRVATALPRSISFLVKNNGTMDLIGVAAAISGTNAADFAITTAPSSSIAPGASSTLTVRFTPEALGNSNANLVITSSDVTTPSYSLILSGTGFTPATAILDDFDPYLDSTVWSYFTGNPQTNTTGAQGGPGSVGSSLWFGGAGSRSAVTVAVNTTGGGNVIFRLSLGNNSGSNWDQPETGEGVVVEYSNNGTTFTQIGSTSYTNTTWQVVAIAIPAAAMTSATQFRIRQLANSGAGHDHWAIDNLHIGTGAIAAPEIEVDHPVGNSLVDGASTIQVGNIVVGAPNLLTFTIRNVGTTPLTGIATSLAGTNPGDFSVTLAPATSVAALYSTTLVLRFQPTAAGARSATLRVASNDGNENPFDINLSGTATAALTGLDFAILSLGSTPTATVDHSALSGASRGGVAASGSTALVTGATATAVYPASLAAPGLVAAQFDGICGDVGTGEIYTLAHGNSRISSASTSASQLQRLNPLDGATTATFINLSQTIPLASGGGIFSGYGRILIHNGSSVYEIRTPSGTVTNLGSMAIPSWHPSATWAVWGATEYFGGKHYLCYRDGGNDIVRCSVPDRRVEIIKSFTNLGNMANFTVSPKLGSWFFHHQLASQFGTAPQLLGRAAATFSAGNAVAPTVMSRGKDTFVRGNADSYQVIATASPTSYSASGIPTGMTFSTSTGLLSGVPTASGIFNVQFTASNGSGSGNKTVVITVYEPLTAFFDGFDPAMDTPLWVDVQGSPAANTTGQLAGSGSTGNSLHFSSGGARTITTRPLDTRGGGIFSFKFAAANGTGLGWNSFSITEGVILEYSTNGDDFVPLGGPYFNRGWETAAVVVPVAARSASTFFRIRQPIHSGASQSQWALDDVSYDAGGVPTPDIALENAAGTPFRSGHLIDWEKVHLEQNPVLAMVVKNYGAAALTELSASFTGVNRDDCLIQGLPGSLASGAAANIQISFKPLSEGPREAELEIVSDDGDESPYRLPQKGFGIDTSPTGRARINFQQTATRLVFYIGAENVDTVWVEAAGLPNLKYQWYRNGKAVSGARGPLLPLERPTLAQAGRYHCKVSNVVAGKTYFELSTPVEVIVADINDYPISIKAGSATTLPCYIAGNGLTYEWYKDPDLIAGAVGKTLKTASLPGPATHYYTCRINVGGGRTEVIAYRVLTHELPPLLDSVDFLTPGKVGAPYTYQVGYHTDVARAPSRFNAIGLPAGVSISPSGFIQGTPRVSGEFFPTITASNSAGKATFNPQFVCQALPVEHTGTFAGLVSANAGLNAALGGHVSFTVTKSAALTGNLLMGREAYRFTGTLDPTNDAGSVFATNLPRVGRYPLHLTLLLTPEGGLGGAVRALGDAVSINGGRNNFHRGNPVTGKPGKFTFALTPPPGRPDAPEGAMHGRLSLTSSSGNVALYAKLPDGTVVTRSAFLQEFGSAGFFKVLYPESMTGSITGWFALPDEGNPSAFAMVDWTRPPNPSSKERIYKAGFETISMQGPSAGYSPPVSPSVFMNANVLLPDNAQLAFTHSSALPTPGPDITFSIEKKNKLTLPKGGSLANPRSTTLKVDPTTGGFSGTFMADGQRRGTFSGILVEDRGYGFFLLPSAAEAGESASRTPILSGSVTLTPSP
ncbi:MAG: M6 family metalloprotease domain-containing protein [Verrucomicrobiaceae bacterium]|nr:M6 family metalloprotease domain-containing protein [Verrucomicrobiaceae bacterium]